MTAIFVDTSALLPLLDRDDQDHTAVVAALGEFNPSQTTLAKTITSSNRASRPFRATIKRCVNSRGGEYPSGLT